MNTSVRETLIDSDVTLAASLESQAAALAKIVVPVNDDDVRSRLRALHEPAVLFGESAPERRQRLRLAMHQRGLTGAEQKEKEQQGGASKLAVRTQDVFSRGTPELKAWREALATASMQAAAARIARLKSAFAAHKAGSMAVEKAAELERLAHLSVTKFSAPIGAMLTTVCAAHPSSSSSMFAVGREDGEVELWDADGDAQDIYARGKPIASANAGHGSRITHIAASAAGLLASSTRTRVVTLWKVNDDDETLTRVADLHGHLGPVNRCAFGLNGAALATTSEDITFRMWDVATQQTILVQDGHHPHCRNVWGAAFHPDGSLLTTTDFSGTALTWDLRSGKCAWRLPIAHDGKCTAVDWAADGVRFATGGEDGVALVWDARRITKSSGSSLAENRAALVAIAAHTDIVTSVRFTPGCVPAAVFTSSLDRSIRGWDVDTGAAVVTILGHVGGVRSFDFVRPSAAAAGGGTYGAGMAIVSAARDPNWRLAEAVEFVETSQLAEAAHTSSSIPPAVVTPPPDGDDDSEDEMAALRKKKARGK